MVRGWSRQDGSVYVCVRERAIRACHCRHMKVSARRRLCVCLSKHNMRCRVCTVTMFVLRLCFDSKYIVVVKRTPKFALPIPKKQVGPSIFFNFFENVCAQ